LLRFFRQQSHLEEKTKLVRQLKQAKTLVEQLEQDKVMAVAEAKRQMHEMIEAKDKEVCARFRALRKPQHALLLSFLPFKLALRGIRTRTICLVLCTALVASCL